MIRTTRIAAVCASVCDCTNVCVSFRMRHVFLVSMSLFFFNLSEALRTKELMTMSGREAGISLLTSSIPHLHFISGHATSRGPHVKGQAGLRYHCDCMLPYGQAGRQAGKKS